MKATDLMIGDWVSYNGHPVLVEALNKSNGYAIEKDMISIKLTDDTCLGINAERLEPLPLTVEILEKNGFVLDSNNVFYLRENIKYGLIKDVDYGYWYANRADAYKEYVCPCDYVHELQRILKLSKIDKEIIL